MNVFGSVKDKLIQYVEVYVKLFKLNFMGSTAKLLSYFMFALICMFLVFIVVLLMGLGIVETFILLGMAKAWAFFATLGIYLLILTIVIMLRENITGFFAGTFLKLLTEEGNDEDKSETPKGK